MRLSAKEMNYEVLSGLEVDGLPYQVGALVLGLATVFVAESFAIPEPEPDSTDTTIYATEPD